MPHATETGARRRARTGFRSPLATAGALGGILLAALFAAPGPACADPTPITIACTATSDCASAFVAADQGFFAAHGLAASVVPIGLNSNIPAALLSNTAQFGGTTLPVFLQAVDGGLGLVVAAGASVTAATTARVVGVVGRGGVALANPADYVDRKVGVPGIGAFLDVLFRRWLIDAAVDPRQVTFVEVPFPSMTDVLRTGGVDAVVTGEPFLSRTVAAGAGRVVANFMHGVPDGEAIILYAATREYAESNKPAVAAFRAAVTEGAAFVNTHADAARDSVARHTGLPMEVLRSVPLSVADATVTRAQLDWWVGVMQRQQMLQSAPDTAALLPGAPPGPPP